MEWFRRRHVKLGLRKSGSLLPASSSPEETLVNELPCLPTEILGLIVQHMIAQSDRETLKAMRYLGGDINRGATAILFHTIHLSANNLSLDRLKSVAATPHLAPCVCHIVLHKGSWALNKEELYDDNHFQTLRMLEDSAENNSVWRLNARGRLVLSPSTSPQVLEQKNKNLIAELRNQWAPGDTWIHNLKDFIKVEAFPNLTELQVPRWLNENLSEYYVRQTGRVQTLTINSPFDLRSIMSGIVHTSLKVLDLQDLYMDGFFEFRNRLNGRRPFPSDQLEKLEVLRLGFRERDPTESPSFDWPYVLRKSLGGLNGLMQACAPSLKELYLRIGPGSLSAGRPTLTSRTEQIETTRTVIRRQYPCLRQLTLVDFAIDEDSFLNFLSLHSKTLRILSMTNWVMPVRVLESNSWLKTSHSSSLRALWKIPQLTTLDKVHLDGHFTTTNAQGLDSPCGWRAQHNDQGRAYSPETHTIREKCSSDNLEAGNNSNLKLDMVEKIELYLMRKASFPFSDVLQCILETDDYTFLAPTFEGLLDEETEGNDQWNWTLDAVPQIIPVEDQDSSWRFVDQRRPQGFTIYGLAHEPWSSWYRIHG